MIAQVKPLKQITSPDNDIFRALREALDSKGIRKHGQFMVFGARAVRDTLLQHPALARNLLLCNAQPPTDPAALESLRIAEKLASEHTPLKFSLIDLARPLFEELDIFGTRFPILVMQAPSLADADLQQPPKGLEVLCALSDPANLGALLRSAAAFGASRVVLLKESASPFHPRAIRAASATTLNLSLARGPSIRELEGVHGPVIALDMQGQSLNLFEWPENTRLLLGEEGLGVPEDLKGVQFMKIPMAPGVESLNATVAASIALYSFRSKKMF